MNRVELGIEIRKAREARGWTQESLARATSVEPNVIQIYENGVHHPSAEMLARISSKLEVPLEQHDRWFAAVGRLPFGLLSQLLDHPQKWEAVRALLRAP